MTTQTNVADRFINASGLRLHYREWGEATAPPLVMIHGLSGNAHNFDALAPIAAGHYRVLAIDVRGRGDSDWAPDGDYSTEAHVRDLEGLREALALPRFSLVGTSMGGRIGLAYAGRYPERVERAVINDVGPEVDMRGGMRIAQYMREAPLRFPSIEEAVAFHRANYPFLRSLSDADMKTYAGYSLKPHPEGGLTWKLDPAVRSDPRRPEVGYMWDLTLRITASVLLIRGSESDILSPEVAQRMVAEMRDCRLVVVPGVGHAPTLAEPEALGAIRALLGLP